MKECVDVAELDELTYRLECAVQALSVTHDAMENGGFAAKTYSPAILSNYLYLDILVKELRGMIEDAPKETTE